MEVETESHVITNEQVPAEKYNLRFLLLSGNKTDMICDPTETVEQVKERVFEQWPKGTIEPCL